MGNDGKREVLVGSTGFVGGNLAASHSFDLELHSSNVGDAFGGDNGLLVYAGVPAAMFLANKDPEADLEVMRQARANMLRMNAERTVLISTIAVYADSRGKDERDEPGFSGLSPYGRNRLQLEKWVREDFSDALIVRLPALYGMGLKKNFIYDIIHVAPSLLSDALYGELAASSELIKSSYEERGNGFWGLSAAADPAALKEHFTDSAFNALSFTDSRSRFQYYDLRNLWADICIALENGLHVLNVSTPPLSAARVYEAARGREWVNHLDAPPFDYDMRTMHAALWNGEGGYIGTAQSTLDSLVRFIGERDAEI